MTARKVPGTALANSTFCKVSALLLILLFPGASYAAELTAEIVREGQKPALSGNGEWVAYPCEGRKKLCISDTTTLQTEILFEVEDPVRDLVQHVDIDASGMKIVYWLRPSGNGSEEIWLYDRNTNTQQMVSVNPDGAAGSQNTSSVSSLHSEPYISGNGQYVLFGSYADDLVSDDDNETSDVFIRDLDTQTTTLISRNPQGRPGNDPSGRWGRSMGISYDGQTAVFISEAEDLDADDIADNQPPFEYDSEDDAFLADLKNGTVTRISEVVGSFIGGNDSTFDSSLSDDGEIAAFTTDAINLSNSTDYPQLLLWKRQTDTLTLMNPRLDGGDQYNQYAGSCPTALTGDGSLQFFCADWHSGLTPTPPPANTDPSLQTHARSAHGIELIRPLINGVETAIDFPATNMTGEMLAAQAELDLGNGVETVIVLIKDMDLLPPTIEGFKVIPDTPLVQGLLAEITGIASDLNRGNKLIAGAEYRIDSGLWQNLMPIDGAYDSTSEAFRGFLDSSGLAEGMYNLCARTVDSLGEFSDEFCKQIVVVAGAQDNKFLLSCHHEPVWPKVGEKVTIKLTTRRLPLDEFGTPTEVGRTEIWLNDNTAPIIEKDQAGQFSLEFETAELEAGQFTYGCRAKQDDNAVFTGWRTVSVGPTGGESAIPVYFTGPSSERVDIVLVADSDSYSGPDDQRFVRDIGVLFEGLFHHELFASYQHLFNIWIAKTTGSILNQVIGGIPRRRITKPVDWDENYAFADTGAVIHSDQQRDFAIDGMFTVEPGSIATFRHETGHSPFGLADEYCCDGGYFETEQKPNVYETLQACEDDAPNLEREVSDCRSIDSVNHEDPFYTSEPVSNDLMIDNRAGNAADIRRFEWLFEQCAQGEC